MFYAVSLLMWMHYATKTNILMTNKLLQSLKVWVTIVLTQSATSDPKALTEQEENISCKWIPELLLSWLFAHFSSREDRGPGGSSEMKSKVPHLISLHTGNKRATGDLSAKLSALLAAPLKCHDWNVIPHYTVVLLYRFFRDLNRFDKIHP